MTDLLATTRQLTPLIEAAADRSEEQGTMPDDVVDALADAGLFWVLVPQELGGLEVDVRTAIEVFDELAYADGSTGWSLMANATSSAFASVYLPDETALPMFVDGAERPDPGHARRLPIHGGMFGPVGEAVQRDGALEFTGRYSFGSGTGHSDWIAAGAMLTVDGEPALDELGLPDMRVAFVPRDQVTFTGNWNALGLSGTGSFDYTVDHVLVPEDRTFRLLTCVPLRGGDVFRIGLFALTALGHAGFATGVGRRAIDEIVRIAQDKARLGADPIASQQLFQHDLAIHDAAMRSARAFVFEAFEELEAAVSGGGDATNLQVQRVRQATTYATRVAADACRFAYTWAGSAGLRQPSVVGRCFRDISAGTQHLFVDNNTLTGYAQALLQG